MFPELDGAIRCLSRACCSVCTNTFPLVMTTQRVHSRPPYVSKRTIHKSSLSTLIGRLYRESQHLVNSFPDPFRPITVYGGPLPSVFARRVGYAGLGRCR